MPKFRKKPVVIEARRFTGEPDADLERWIGDQFESWVPSKRQLVIRTREGDMFGSAGDWIIQGVAGEFYACKPDIFAETYEPVEG
jgi:hypothetical protein